MSVTAPKTPHRPQTAPTKSTTTPATSKDTKSTVKKSRRKPSLTPAELAEQARVRAIADVELARERELNTYRLKNSWERIFEKYGKDLDGVADEVDILTGKVFVDNGHLRAMPDESDKESDSDGISWRNIISPEKKENRPRKNKRKRDQEDDGGEELAAAKAARVEETIFGENGTCTPRRSNSPDILPMSVIMDSSMGKTPPQEESILTTDTPRSSKLLTDDGLAYLGECGPPVLEILRNSGAKSNIQRSPGTSTPKPAPPPGTNSVSSSPPVAASSPLTRERTNHQHTNTTPNTASNTTSSKLSLKKKKETTVFVIPDDEQDELSAPNSPTVSSSFRKPSNILKKSTPKKGKTRLSITISADESEDELQSCSANTPTVSSRPTPTTSKPPISTPTFKRPTMNTPKPSQAPRPKPALTAEKLKATPHRRSPPSFNVWAPFIDDPFYDPKWHDEHPDGTPRQFPSPAINTIFNTPAPLKKTPKAVQPGTSPIAESPAIRALKRGAAIGSPNRRKGSISIPGTPRRNNTVTTPSGKKREKEPVTPGWTSTPLRRGTGLMDLFGGNEDTSVSEDESGERSLIVVKIPAKPRSQTENDAKVNTPTQHTKGATIITITGTPTPPPSSSATPPRSTSNRRPTRSSPASSDSELEIVGVRRVNGLCGKIQCGEFCFECISASELPV
ncbi:hypothetical protein K440DRAFT_644430 [Wilcoxina mikolae CBS 423.85]|nr:hypothetical protein K440DRAFT_644430 [Wilcoxina mikolae CBS 423.85]